MPGCALIQQADECGGYEYMGGTDMWWDEQWTKTDEQGRVNLVCRNGHDWWTEVTDPEGLALPEVLLKPQRCECAPGWQRSVTGLFWKAIAELGEDVPADTPVICPRCQLVIEQKQKEGV
ncbi:MAG TPA: hypothetical protein VNL14_16500 [Candidatus Acidoferrales bacterium]|nr:hypothetical protein [Candidatus Acidoferrales bacterium]